ncbi:MAG: nitroreductase family protein [Anaerolineales bacterium]
METADAIRTKRAVREFAHKDLPEAAILRIVNAGRRAQSSKNTQPWSFVVVRDPSIRQELSRLGTYAGHIAGAAMAVVLVSVDPATKPSILFDLGQAAAYMQLAAWDVGIGSCLVTLYEPGEAAELLRLPPDQHARFAISFGYPADPTVITAPPKPTGRRPIQETVHWERWSGAG